MRLAGFLDGGVVNAKNKVARTKDGFERNKKLAALGKLVFDSHLADEQPEFVAEIRSVREVLSSIEQHQQKCQALGSLGHSGFRKNLIAVACVLVAHFGGYVAWGFLSPSTQENLAKSDTLFQMTKVSPNDTQDEIDVLHARAERGDAEAQAALGRAYASGDGVLESKTDAIKWFRKAAEQGHADSQCVLGVLYLLGDGVPQDKEEGVKWLYKAAKQGHEPANEIITSLMAPPQQQQQSQQVAELDALKATQQQLAAELATLKAQQQQQSVTATRSNVSSPRQSATNPWSSTPSSPSNISTNPGAINRNSVSSQSKPAAPKTCYACGGGGLSKFACTQCRGTGLTGLSNMPMACSGCGGRKFQKCGTCSGTGTLR